MPGRPPHQRDDDSDRERRVEPDLGIDTGDDGEADRFGYQGQRNDQAGENVIAGIAQPFALKRVHCGHEGDRT
jgi:hypothetical protein